MLKRSGNPDLPVLRPDIIGTKVESGKIKIRLFENAQNEKCNSLSDLQIRDKE